MRTRAWAGIVIGLLVVAGGITCKKAVPELDPKSGYARLRPAIIKAVNEFPAAPGTLARCAPGLGRMPLFTLRQAAMGLNVALARPQPGFTSADVRTYADEHLQSLERHDFADYNYNSFEGATRFAMFGTIAATTPVMTDCEQVANPNPSQMKQLNCKLTRGLIDGNLVVFDAKGDATCAVSVKVEGPFNVAGSYGVTGDMSSYVHQVLQAVVESAAGGPWIAKLSLPGKYAVSVEGALVSAAPER